MKCHVCRAGNLIRQQIGWSCDRCKVAVRSAVPRYRIYPMPSAPASVIETPDGEWCQWNDIQEEMTTLRTLAEKCRALCEEADAELTRMRAELVKARNKEALDASMSGWTFCLRSFDLDDSEWGATVNEIPLTVVDIGHSDKVVVFGFPPEVVALKARVAELEAAGRYLLESIEPPPDRNCTCHISPPCHDCVEFGALREAIDEMENAIAKGGKPT